MSERNTTATRCETCLAPPGEWHLDPHVAPQDDPAFGVAPPADPAGL
jgi:hypothetical protein